jgi:hypothetical protein
MTLYLALAAYLGVLLFVWWCAETERDLRGRRKHAASWSVAARPQQSSGTLRPGLPYAPYARSVYLCRLNTSGRSTPMYGRLR